MLSGLLSSVVAIGRRDDIIRMMELTVGSLSLTDSTTTCNTFFTFLNKVLDTLQDPVDVLPITAGIAAMIKRGEKSLQAKYEGTRSSDVHNQSQSILW